MIKCKCGKLAVWLSAPNYEDEELNKRNRDYCDDCVPREPCSCIFHSDTNDYERDELGRYLPCADYMYSEKGFLSDKESDLEYYFIETILQSMVLLLSIKYKEL